MNNPTEIRDYPCIDFEPGDVEILRAIALERMAENLGSDESQSNIDTVILDTMDEKNPRLRMRTYDDVYWLAKRILDFADRSYNAKLEIKCTFLPSTAIKLCEERDRQRDGALEIARSILKQLPAEEEASRILAEGSFDADDWLKTLSSDSES